MSSNFDFTVVLDMILTKSQIVALSTVVSSATANQAIQSVQAYIDQNQEIAIENYCQKSSLDIQAEEQPQEKIKGYLDEIRQESQDKYMKTCGS